MTESKSMARAAAPSLGEGLPLHFVAAMATGLVSTTLSNPLDVLKAYTYMRPGVPLRACVAEMMRDEGVGALLKGWTASYARTGPHTVLILLFNEQIRLAVGSHAF